METSFSSAFAEAGSVSHFAESHESKQEGVAMSPFRLRWPSAALVVSFVALFVALGGTSYAVMSVPDNSVGPKQLEHGAVTSGKIKNGAVSAAKLSELAARALGPRILGTTFRQVAYAHVAASGAVSSSKGISAKNVTLGPTGTYCLSGLPFTPKGGSVTIDAASSSAAFAELHLGGVVNCNSGRGVTVEVDTQFSSGTFGFEPFYILLYR